MKKETLISKVDFILDPASLKEMQMFGLKKNSAVPYKINVDQDFVSSIIEVVAEGIKSIIVDRDYEIVDYSTADERKKRYYRYDINDIPDSMKVLSMVIGNADIEDYNMKDDKIEGLDNLIIVISNGTDKCFSIFKHLSTIEKIATSSKAVLGFFGDRVLKSVSETFLRISPSFQVIYTSNNYILTNESFAESSFKLHDVLKREADKLTKRLEHKKIVYDLKKIKQYNDTPSFCRKLVKVLKDSKVLEDDFDKSNIFTFLDRDDTVREQVLIKDIDGEKFIEVNNKTAANVLLEILNDEFVKSEITGTQYKAPDKDKRKKR